MQIHLIGIRDRHLITVVSVIKRLSLYEITLWGRDFVSVVRIRKSRYYGGFFKENIWEFLGTLETVRNREVSVPRGSTLNKWDSYSTAIVTYHFGQNHQFRKIARLDFSSFKKTTFFVRNKPNRTTGQTQVSKRYKNCIENIQIKDNIKLKCNSNNITFFFQACERAESSKSCNLIGSESGLYFTILPANPGGIVGSFIHKFVCCLWMSKNRHFQIIFLSKLALLLELAREKWILLFRQKIWRENQASKPGKQLK